MTLSINPVSTSNHYNMQKKDGSVIITYDDPAARDEERKYIFNEDGSASSISLAWGVKTSLPKGTFKPEQTNLSPEEMVNLFKSYQSNRKLDVQA